jgi:D-alanyl-D-alanine carboxypeptidase/D-alanyl-D-alanine-endopeptidase (penicillin-binding protein 4)
MKYFCLTLRGLSPNLFLFLTFLISNNAVADHSVEHLPASVTKILAKHKVPKDSLSLYIQEFDSSDPLVALNIDIPRNPASVIKLLITYAGLDILGPNYTWETHVHLDGKLDNGTLDGNLIIEGRGDPFLVRETFWHLLYTLRNRGIQHINGDLLIDNEHFENENGSPADFDNKPYRVYNTFPDAALLNFRAHQFHFIPMDKKLHIYADPPASNLQIRNKVKLIKGACKGKHRQLKFNVIKQGSVTTVEFSGNYPKRCGNQDLLRTVLPNGDYVFGVFKALWENMGGTINGKYGETSIDDNNPFYIVPSKPLREVITYINKYSNNVMTRQLLLTIGKENNNNNAGNKTAGRKVISDWLQSIGIPAPELIIENGSGLSRSARISARTLAMLLQHALQSSYQPEYFSSLPLVGIDGTVRKRLKGIIPPGSARIKTGIIDNVRSMAGYVKSKNNKNYIIVSLQNYKGIQNTTGTLVQDEVLKWLYKQ